MNEFEATYKWLSREKFAYRHHAIDLLVNRMRQSLENRNFPQTRALLKELKSTADTLAPELVQAYIRIECACAAYEMNEFDEAFTNIDQAIDILEPLKHQDLEYSHIYAVSYWLLGMLLVKIPDQHHAAVSALQVCLDTFRSLTYWPESHFNGGDWYKKRCKAMERGIETVVTSAISAGTAAVGARPAPPARPAWPVTEITEERKAILKAGPFKKISVVSEISAGPPSGVNPVPIEKISLKPLMEDFIIEGESYNLYNIWPKDYLITLAPSKKYYILKIDGDSMNEAGIESGNYVLLREQSTADNNYDIVAAINVDEGETTATLKMYVKKNSTVELHPKSKNKKHKPYPIDKSKEGTYIRGVVLGVFK